ncbi:hypothetical protein LTR84_002098 [Exophiala bonariae]|uniref:Uncharacterized protein n=1 Tax=Exophiala bonariae TaxID=1690606 RepID=A0AAV9NDZ6_9EURO|nr:hypothetical protein LTR84_002098 [Exophiala bonariae]
MAVRIRSWDLPLLAIAVTILPISTFLLVVNYLYICLFPRHSIRRRLRTTRGFGPRTVLLTGVNTPQGLRLAGAFHDTGHNVIGLDYESGLPTPARFSRAVHRFYPLRVPSVEGRRSEYVNHVTEIVEKERVDLWLNCITNADPDLESQVRTRIERITTCRCFALSLDDAPCFARKDKLLSYMQSLGLPVPEVHQVRSRDELHKVLNRSHGQRKYLLHATTKQEANNSRIRARLPRRTLSQTYNLVSRINITQSSPWVLEQDTDEMEKYSTFAITVRGEIKAFVASYSTDNSSFQLLDPDSALSQSMLRFVSSLVKSQGCNLTIHLNMDFRVEEWVTATGVVKTILPVDVSTQADVNTLLFRGIAGSAQLTRAYLACLQSADPKENPTTDVASSYPYYVSDDGVSFPVFETFGVYNFGQMVHTLAVTPLRHLLTFKVGPRSFLKSLASLVDRLLHWTNDSYSIDDPLPFWWYHQVCVPLEILIRVITGPSTFDRPDIKPLEAA